MTRTTHEQDAYNLGVEHARNAASWVNTDDAPGLLVRMAGDDPELGASLPACPNLSGEWADSPTPQSIYRDITGLDPSERISENEDAIGDVISALCDAYEQGVTDSFLPECERILRAALR